MNSPTFFEQADQLVNEFYDHLRNDDDTDLGTFIASDSPLYDRDELAKHLRKVWLQWAREKKAGGEPVPDGWLTEFHQQSKDHQEVQRLQADAMFALGYQAAIEDMRQPTPEAKAKLKQVKPSKRSTIQAFTSEESRMLIASFMAFITYNLKRKKLAIEKQVVDRLLAKLEVLSNLNLNHVEYLPLQSAEAASRVKPKWKKHAKPRKNGKPKPTQARHGLGHLVNKKGK